MRLTKSFIEKIELPTRTSEGKARQVFYRDEVVPGLALRVTSGGAKSYVVEKRIKGRVRRHTIGTAGAIHIDKARKEAMKFLGEVAANVDPIAKRQAEQIKGITLQAVFDDYLLTRKNLKPTTISDYKRSVETGFSDWLARPISDINKSMVELRLRQLGRKSHARANNSLRVLRALCNHAMRKYEDEHGQPIMTVNPVTIISHNRAWYDVPKRQRIIKLHELPQWFDAVDQLHQHTTRDFLHFLLFTGLRRSECARLQWEHIDFKDETFTIPDTKNRRSHTLPFSSHLRDLLTRRYESRINAYVFPSHSVIGHLIEPKTAVAKVSKDSKVPFTLHDLRRTFITLAESLDIPHYALKRLLNHKNSNDITASYIISDVNRLRIPMQKVCDALIRCRNKQSQVVRFGS